MLDVRHARIATEFCVAKSFHDVPTGDITERFWRISARLAGSVLPRRYRRWPALSLPFQ